MPASSRTCGLAVAGRVSWKIWSGPSSGRGAQARFSSLFVCVAVSPATVSPQLTGVETGSQLREMSKGAEVSVTVGPSTTR